MIKNGRQLTVNSQNIRLFYQGSGANTGVCSPPTPPQGQIMEFVQLTPQLLLVSSPGSNPNFAENKSLRNISMNI